MATADKLTTVAENVPKVYQAGQMNVVENAECLKGIKTDTAMLINDVSPVTHKMGVKVRGKNLFDISKITNTSGITNNGDGTITIKENAYSANSGKYLRILCPNLKVGDIACLSLTTMGSKAIRLVASSKTWNSGKSITITQTDLDSSVIFYGHSTSSELYGSPCTISNIQIELGTTATEYTPYIPDLTAVKFIKSDSSGETVAEYTPNADGTVEGVTSLYPNTTLTTDTDGVIIDCEYYKDVDKAFDELTQAMTEHL